MHRTLRAGRFPARLALAMLALGGAGCGDDANLIGPENQLEVHNLVDSFEWQVTALDRVTQTLTYAWQHSGTSADVNQSASLSAGSASLRVLDDGGVEVYDRDLTENGTFQTDAGTAGDWTVVVRLSGASGAVNFRIDKP
ncbi:MAG TPA: hypothetical protein VLA33_07710 [Gemmatimonadota bacterium]|nr:hypothetical protein [Gemmatimonadota bacterium]